MESPLRDYLKIVRRQAWLIVLVTVAAVVLTAVIVKLQQPVYRAATTLVVGEPHGELPPVLGSTSVTRTMTTLLESDLVARSVIDELNLDVSKEDFKQDLKVEVLPDTAVLRVAYDSTDQQLALDVVSELAAIFTQRVGETLGVSTTGQSALRSGSFDLIVRVFDAPHVEPAPRPKQTVQKLLIAVPVGLVLGLLLAVARTSLSVRIWERKEAEEWLGAPVVASISKAVRRRLSPASEEELVRPPIEALRTRFQLARMGMSGPIVVVTSAAREGATTAIAANLAIALAQTGKQVVCVDAGDGSGASLASWFHATGEGPGLADVLEGRSQLEEALVPVNVHLPSADGAGAATGGQLELLPASDRPATLAAMTSPHMVEWVMDALRARADLVVIQCPPLLVPEPFTLALHADQLLVLVRCGRTTREQADAARETLADVAAERVGIVLTDARAPESNGSTLTGSRLLARIGSE